MSSKYYFAYGSNLNNRDWQDWCRDHGFCLNLLQKTSVGYLPDYDVAFRHRSVRQNGGTLDLVDRKGQAVPGIIFEVRNGGWEALDRKEGAPRHYRRVRAVALDKQGREFDVVTYRCFDKKDFVQPHPNYVKIVREGLEDHDIDDVLLDAAANDRPTPWLISAIFVYGTLMRGESRFSVLKRAGLKCTLLAQIRGRLVDLGHFPGLLDVNGSDGIVEGEFVRVQNFATAINELDAVEGFGGFDKPGSLYRRTLVRVHVGDGRVRQAWTYRYADSMVSATRIHSGSWRQHRGSLQEFARRLIEKHTGGDDLKMVKALASRVPYCVGQDHDTAVRSLLPLESALRRGDVSERRLAQMSGNWTAVA